MVHNTGLKSCSVPLDGQYLDLCLTSQRADNGKSLLWLTSVKMSAANSKLKLFEACGQLNASVRTSFFEQEGSTGTYGLVQG